MPVCACVRASRVCVCVCACACTHQCRCAPFMWASAYAWYMHAFLYAMPVHCFTIGSPCLHSLPRTQTGKHGQKTMIGVCREPCQLSCDCRFIVILTMIRYDSTDVSAANLMFCLLESSFSMTRLSRLRGNETCWLERFTQVYSSPTFRASLSGTFLQTLPRSVTPLSHGAISVRSVLIRLWKQRHSVLVANKAYGFCGR